MKERGVAIPDEYEGITRDTYKDLFLKDPGKAKEIMLRFIGDYLEEIPPHKALAGDILLLSLRSTMPFLAIAGGNGNIVAASVEHGVSVTPRKHYTIQRAYRWHN